MKTAQNKLFDVILYMDDTEKGQDFINDLKDRSDCNIIVADIICSEETKEIRETYKSDNIIFIDAKGYNKSKAYNKCLEICSSSYVTFAIPNMKYRVDSLENMTNLIEKQEYTIIAFTPIHKEKRYASFGYRDNETMVDLKTNSQSFILYIYAYFFQRKLISQIKFDENLNCDGTVKFLLEALNIEQRYLLIKNAFYYYEPLESEYFAFKNQFLKEWYIESMKDFICKFTQEDSPLFIKYAITYLIQCRYACNLDTRNKSILNTDEVNEFFKDTGKALKYIDDYIISNNRISNKHIIPKYLTLNLLRLKYNNVNIYPNLTRTGLNITSYLNGATIDKLSNEDLEIQVIYFDEKNLTMDGVFRGLYLFGDKKIEIVSRINEKEYPVRRTETYSLNKVFNVAVRKSYTFQFSIPSNELSDATRIKFYLKYDGEYYPLKVIFKRAQSKLTSKFKSSYWLFDKKMLTYSVKKKAFIVRDAKKIRLIKKEIKLWTQFIKDKSKILKWKSLLLRIMYWVTKIFYKKEIWITMDKIFKAGDNGEYMYEYIKKRNPKNIKIYYIVSRDSYDYKRLKKKYGNGILRFGSIRQKLISLHSNIILATHVDVMNCCGFNRKKQQYFKDLFNPKIVCIAHGLTIQKIAQYQDRVFDNTVLYFFASKYEIENVKHPIYDYYDESMLKLTGHARYDGLINNDKKQILITPTWRKGTTVGSTVKGSSYSYSDTFKGSEYFNIYNKLINDEKLIKCAKNNGYKIIYLLHPAMSSQIIDFDKNDNVEIIAATSNMSYEKILTESSLMVTDYSGVQFDFAYMYKPVVYFHPNSLPAQYEEGGLKYETMGFGPVCRTNDDVVNKICEYIENDCKINNEYKNRIDDFFKYHDHNNCKRIYEEVMKFNGGKNNG